MRLIAWLILLWLPMMAEAQPAAPSPPIVERAATLLKLLGSGTVDEADFAPSFLQHVPAAKVEAIAKALLQENGPVTGMGPITPETDQQATVRIDYGKAAVTARIVLEPDGAHRFIGLLITGAVRKDDSFSAIIEEMKALSGTTSLLVAQLDGADIKPVAELNPDKPMAVGSAFKLFVLAALAQDVASGRKHWEDVVPLGPASLPSGVTQTWPPRSPVTLATLATQMISISDNTATDTLMNTLGRTRVDTMRAAHDHSAAALPVLTTREAFALKMRAAADIRGRWASGDMTTRRMLLSAIDIAQPPIDPAQLAGKPLSIDTVEWPASMRALAQVLGRFRGEDGTNATARAILAVNPSASANDQARLAYIGFKGGSESGVLALSWLLKTRDDRWFVVAGARNNLEVPIEPEGFERLLRRVLVLIGREAGPG